MGADENQDSIVCYNESNGVVTDDEMSGLETDPEGFQTCPPGFTPYPVFLVPTP